MLTKSTSDNISRIDSLIESSFRLCPCCGLPLPSWIEISPIDFCTRKCMFCPKGSDAIAPNQMHLFMNINLVQKIAKDISDIEFKGTILLGGYGEPMAAPNIMQIIKIFSPLCRVEIVTNGDLLTTEKLLQALESGVSFIAVSIYDGPENNEKFMNLFESEGIPKNKYILRDRWYDSRKNFGIKLTNRAGLIDIGNQPKIDRTAQCFYPHYSMMIDWNGDVLLCPQDWHRRIKFGNTSYASIHDIWISKYYKKYRDKLFKGERTLFPCSECNCSGIIHGKTHAEKWCDSSIK